MTIQAQTTTELGFTCQLCGARGIARNPNIQEVTCPKCRSTFRSNEIAATLLKLIDGGVSETLSRLAANGRLGDRMIVDFTGDPALERILNVYSGYRNVPLFEENDAASDFEFWGNVADRLIAIDNASADVILVRDAVRTAPDLDWLMDELARICRKGGLLILQDRYSWPFELTTRTLMELRDGAPVNLAPPAFTRLGKNRETPIYRIVGADFLKDLRARGFLVHADRAASPLDFYYRSMVVVANRL